MQEWEEYTGRLRKARCRKTTAPSKTWYSSTVVLTCGFGSIPSPSSPHARARRCTLARMRSTVLAVRNMGA